MLGNYASSQLGPADEKRRLVSSATSHYSFLFHLFFLFIDLHYGRWARLEDRAGWKLIWGIKKKKKRLIFSQLPEPAQHVDMQ